MKVSLMSEVVEFAEELVTEISMSHAFKKWLILEGISDQRLFLARYFPNKVKTVVALGWENVVKIVNGCTDFSDKKVIGLVDRDYRDLKECPLDNPNVVCTDFRDIENILFETSALEKVLAELGSLEKLPMKRDGKIDLRKVKSEISSLAEKLGRFRAYCYKYDSGISFEKIDHCKFIDDRQLTLDSEKFLRHLAGNPDNAGRVNDINWSVTQAGWLPVAFSRPEYLRHGHDLMAIIAVSLRRKWASKGGGITRENVESLFRLAAELAELQKYKFWQDLEILLS
jgi:hypothetical protein